MKGQFIKLRREYVRSHPQPQILNPPSIPSITIQPRQTSHQLNSRPSNFYMTDDANMSSSSLNRNQASSNSNSRPLHRPSPSPDPMTLSRPGSAPQPNTAVDKSLFELIESESNGAFRVNVDLDLEPIEMIAEGGAAQIFTARVKQESLLKQRTGQEESVVVKLLKEPANITKERIRAAFQQEVAIMWLLSHHRNFIKFFGYSLEPMAFLSRHYKYGPLSLHIHNIPSPVTMPEHEYTSYFILDAAYDIANGIKEMHDRGIIHNDIKPANILLEKDIRRYSCVLCDYGIAQVVGNPVEGLRTLGQSTARGASAAYAAPEVFERLRKRPPQLLPQVQKAGDVYAYGVCIYEMLMRRLPWLDDQYTELSAPEIEQRVCGGERPPLSPEFMQWRQQDHVVAFLTDIMDQCCTMDVNERPDMKMVATSVTQFRQSVGRQSQPQ